MATPINRDDLLADVKSWLPSDNILSDVQLLKIIESTIVNELPEDDTDLYYSMALCLSLRNAANMNLSLSSTSSFGVNRERVGDVDVTYFKQGVSEGWQSYLDSLRDICPIFGYYGLSAKGGIKITTSTTPNFNPCCDDNDLTF